METWCTDAALVMLYAGTPTSDSFKGAWSGRYEWWALQTFSEGDRVDNAKFFLMGWVFLFVIILINLLVVCAILYILNYNASPQSIL